MLRLILTRLAISVLTLLGAAAAVFFVTQVLPGDTAQIVLGVGASPEAIATVRERLGLDEPAVLRFVEWLFNFVQGDMGQSLAAGAFGNATPINEQVGLRLWNTLKLAGLAAVIAIPLALGLGMYAAVRPRNWFNRAVNFIGLAGISLPEFFVAYIFIAIFAVKLKWFPAMAAVSPDMSMAETLNRMALPVLTLTVVPFTYLWRMTRGCVTDVLSRPFMEMSLLKGLPTWRLVFEHAAPNAIGPLANAVALSLAYLVVGAVVVEVVFVYPGMGQYLVDAVAKRDIPVVQACSLVFALVYVGLNFAADFVAIIANPRLRYPR